MLVKQERINGSGLVGLGEARIESKAGVQSFF